MKTNDLIQLGALALVGFLAYQKFAKGKGSPSPNPPSPNPPYQLPVDMGVNNPSDSTWGDATGATSSDFWATLWQDL